MSALSPTGRVHVRAPGKINVFFAVGDAGEDGYHDVASAYQAVSLYEDLWATPADGFTLSVSGTVDVSGVPLDDRNLALRAARLLAATTGHAGGVHLDVHKGVPVAGGMGGGSADAAAALVACDALWGTGLSAAELQELGARLGADVPFALMGGTAIGSGRGDQLNPALARGRFDWVLVTQTEGLSTPAVYAELDAMRAERVVDIAPPPTRPAVRPHVLQALRAGDAALLAGAVHNDLEGAALRMRPALGDVIAQGEDYGALAAIVSGSGPTVAMLAEDKEEALNLQVSLSAAGLTALHAHGPVPGARVLTH